MKEIKYIVIGTIVGGVIGAVYAYSLQEKYGVLISCGMCTGFFVEIIIQYIKSNRK